MTLTLNVEICNREMKFTELIYETYRAVLKLGCQIVKAYLEEMDARLMETRDRKRYRNKGLKRTCVKTILGAIEYERRVYKDTEAESADENLVYLLDEAYKIEKIGMYETSLCEIIANDICTNTYRGTSEMIKEHTGIDISAQGVWNIVQEAGEKEHGIIERYAELAAKGAAQGKIETQLLYLENDGVFLTLQGKDRKKYGSSHEMKVGIAYDGVKYTRNEDGKITRRTLDTKVAYATMNNSKEFERKKKGLISSVYSSGDIDLIVKNGDGSSWIQKSEKIQTISVLDKFHRNKKVRESVRDAEEVKAIMTLLNNNETEAVVDFIEERLSVKTAEGADYNELKKLSELLSYFSENQEALSSYYSRGIEIPPTRSPELHHARLGSMESNIFTLIGNRMKHRRCCWSIAGANNLAVLLCRKYANGLDDIFMDLPELTGEEIEEDFGPILSHRDATARVGSGYEYPYASEISSEYKGIKLIAHQESFGDLFF